MSTWRYMMSREHTTDGEDIYQIREFYEFDNGETNWTEDPIVPMGDSPIELANELARMLMAVTNGQMLDLTLSPTAVVQRARPCPECIANKYGCDDEACCPSGPCVACSPPQAP